MSQEIKESVQERFGVSAADYAVSDVHAKGESLGLLIELTGPKSDWSGLDIATGAGHTALAFAPRVREVVASDLTEPMLNQTARLAEQRNLKNLRVERADAESLPFANESFDLVSCRLAFHHFPHPDQAVSEMARVLRKGGRLAFTDNVVVDEPESATFYNDYEKRRDPSHVRVQTTSELIGRFERHGLALVACRRLTKEFEFHDWADRQRVSAADKKVLEKMMRSLPAPLTPLFRPRFAENTFYFTLWELVLVAERIY